MFKRPLAALALLSTLAFAGCDGDYQYPEYFGLEAFSINTAISARLTRPDGTPIPDADVIAEIEAKYGFKAQRVVFIVPKIYLQMTSDLDAPLEELASDISVIDWQQTEKDFANDGGALRMTLSIAGISRSTCGVYGDTCALDSDFGAYADHFAAQAKLGVQSNMRMYLQDGEGHSVELQPSLITFNCPYDETLRGHTKEDYDIYDVSAAVQCAGTVNFVLEQQTSPGPGSSSSSGSGM